MTGGAVDVDGEEWVPAMADSNRGWIHLRSVTLEDGDVGFSNSREYSSHRMIHGDFWGGLGPVSVVTSGNTAWGARLSGGASMLLGEDERWILGVSFDVPITNEKVEAPDFGTVHRDSMLWSAGCYFIPHQLYGKASIGLTWLGSDTDGSGSTTEPSYGAALGVRVYEIKKFSASIEADYLYTTSGTLSGGAEEVFEGATPYIPAANNISLNLVVDFIL